MSLESGGEIFFLDLCLVSNNAKIIHMSSGGVRMGVVWGYRSKGASICDNHTVEASYPRLDPIYTLESG